MADKYWVGGTGNWSDATNHWATESGGSPNASNLPTSADDVFIDTFSGGGSITLDSDVLINYLEIYDSVIFDANDFNITSVGGISIYADTDYEPTMVMGNGTWEISYLSISEYYGGVVTIVPETSTIKLVSPDELNIEGDKVFNNLWISGTSSNYCFIGGSNTFNNLKIDPGVQVYFNRNGVETTTTISSLDAVGTVGNLIRLDSYVGALIGGIFSITPEVGSGYNVDDIVTISGGDNNAQIVILSVDEFGLPTDWNFVSYGSGYSTGINVATTGGSGTGLTLTIVSVNETAPIPFNLSKTSGTVECDYLNISNSNATGGATWYAGNHSIDTINNDGWIFSDFVSPIYNDYLPNAQVTIESTPNINVKNSEINMSQKSESQSINSENPSIKMSVKNNSLINIK